MSTSWYSIDPLLTKDGAFAALSTLQRAEQLKPVQIAPKDANLDKASFNIDSRFVSSTVEAQLAYASFFSGSLNKENKLYMWDFSIYKSATTNTPIGGLITGTRYGAALRIGVHLQNLTIDISASFSAIAAAVALNKVEASYKIQGIAFSNALGTIAPELPTSGNFDIAAFTKLVGLGPKLVDWANKNTKSLGFEPIQIAITKNWDDVVADTAQSLYYAMIRIKKGDKLAQAITSLPIGLNDQVVIDTYRRITGTDDRNYEPKGSDQDRAKMWLEFR